MVVPGNRADPDHRGLPERAEEEKTKQLTLWAKVMRAVRFVVAGVIWALTWVLPVRFTIMMSWACESDARRFGQRVTTHYGEEGEDIAIAIAAADRKAGGNRALTVTRGALVVDPVAIPVAFIVATVAGGKGPLGLNVSKAAGALAALALVIGVSIAALRG
jgi:hypothetical protein